MSKERAARRALREAQAEATRARRARRARRRELAARLVPRLPDRRTGHLFARRTRTQRAVIAALAAGAILAVWWEFDALATRIALSALVLVALPALIVLTLDRR